MTNEMKLLRAFIEASGFDIEIVKPIPVSEWDPGYIYDMNTTYKVTKKPVTKQDDMKAILSLLDKHDLSLLDLDEEIGCIPQDELDHKWEGR